MKITLMSAHNMCPDLSLSYNWQMKTDFNTSQIHTLYTKTIKTHKS